MPRNWNFHDRFPRGTKWTEGTGGPCQCNNIYNVYMGGQADAVRTADEQRYYQTTLTNTRRVS